MKKPCITARLLKFGSSTWARTRDTRINSHTLYGANFLPANEYNILKLTKLKSRIIIELRLMINSAALIA